MVNLLGSRSSVGRFMGLDADRPGRVEARLLDLAELLERGRLRALGGAIDSLEIELEELAAAPSRVAALALLEAIDGLRRGACGPASSDPSSSSSRPAPLAGGDYVCHRPGRSLATGEAEIASRGYFDVEDRPPIVCWIGLLSSEPLASGYDADVAIVAWIAPGDLERARAGCDACSNGALSLLADLAPEAHRQLRAIESAVWWPERSR